MDDLGVEQTEETSPKTDTEGGTPPGAGLEAGGEDETPLGARAS